MNALIYGLAIIGAGGLIWFIGLPLADLIVRALCFSGFLLWVYWPDLEPGKRLRFICFFLPRRVLYAWLDRPSELYCSRASIGQKSWSPYLQFRSAKQ